MKGQPWYDVPERTAHVTLVAQERIDPATYASDRVSTPAAARRLSREIQATFFRGRSRGEQRHARGPGRRGGRATMEVDAP